MTPRFSAGDRRRGYLLLPVVLMLAVLGSAAYLVTLKSSVGLQSTVRARQGREAVLVARAGVEHAVFEANADNCSGYSLDTTAFGAHSYSASFSPSAGSPVSISATATLASGLTRTVTRDGVAVYEGATETLFLQPPLSGKDTWLGSLQPARNHGSSAELRADVPGNEHALIEFDLSGLPSTAHVRSATLELFVINGFATTVKAHRLTQPWLEGSCAGGGGCTADGANWTTRDSVTPWSTPGGDYDEDAAASRYVEFDELYGWIDFDISSLVSSWHGGVPNSGLMLVTTGQWIEFASSDQADPSRHPKLTIEYSCQCSPTTAGGQEVLQPGAGSGKDTHLLGSAQGDRNYGAAGVLWVHDSIPYNALLQFDLSNLPSNAIVTDASLELYVQDIDAVLLGVVSVHRVTRDWVEGSGGSSGLTPADGANWSTYDGINPWTTTGGDFDPEVVDSTVAVVPTAQWYQWDVASLVSDWKEGVSPNYGFMLRGIGGLLDKMQIASSDGSTASLHPKLTIDYICPCGAPCTPPAAVGGDLLMVMVDPANPKPQEVSKRALIESWGFTVSTIDETDPAASFDAAIAANDVVLVSDDVDAPLVGSKLVAAPIGVVGEDRDLFRPLGLAASIHTSSGASIDVVDVSHYITSPFDLGSRTVLTTNVDLSELAGAHSSDLLTLATFGVASNVAVLEAGGERWNAFGGVDGRRAKTPWHGMDFDVTNLSDDGRTLFKRTLEWAGTSPSAPAGYLDRFARPTCNPAIDWVGSHGSVDWSSSAWTANDGGNPCSGYARITLRDGSYRLNLGQGVEITRAVDLSSFAVGTLRFRYRTIGIVDASHYLRVDLSDDGGTSFSEVGRIDTPEGAKYGVASYGITPLMDADSVLRFATVGFAATSRIALDDIAIVEEANAGGACANKYLDSVNTNSYDGSDGSLTWSTHWLEINEADGAGGGDEAVISMGGAYRLQVKDNDGGGEGLEREADLSSTISATLSFKYRRDKFDGPSDFVSIGASPDGGASWAELGTIGGAGSDASAQSASYSLDAQLGPHTRIRFLTSPGLGDRDSFWIDEVEICLQ